MNKKGTLLVISGPSGSGKGTIVEKLLENNDYELSISATTRKPRKYEQEGVHYFFKSKEEFDEMIRNEMFLEWACFCGNYYGTPKKYAEELIERGKNVILEIEVQGALKVKKIYDEAVLIFILPPSMDELRHRLRQRGTEDEETISKRINRALEELDLIEYYDYVVMNNDIEKAKKDIEMIVEVQKMKAFNFKNIKEVL